MGGRPSPRRLPRPAGLHRLTQAQRGTATGSPGAYTAFGSQSFTQAFTLDQVGNWSGFDVDADGAGGQGNWDLAQTRGRIGTDTPISR